MRLSLATKLTLVFAAIMLLAIGTLYLYVAPGLETRLVNEKLTALASAAERYSQRLSLAVARGDRLRAIQDDLDAAARDTGDRVSLLSVAQAPGGSQLSLEADSSSAGSRVALRFPAAYRAGATGKPTTGTESTRAGSFAEAASPISYLGRRDVVAFSSSVSDVVRSVATVRHEILVAGGIALLLAILGSYLVARALAQRVKRLERAAERVAAGDFQNPIRVDSTDELGQLAVAFNDMQRQLAQLDLARKKFIATASHELRTPIFSLGGFVELLEDEELDLETRRRFVEQLRDQVERLRKLSVDLLDLSKLESGSLELRPEEVDLGELTRSVSGEFEPVLAQHDSHLELRLAARRITAVCDPVRVAQIMRILIDNALTHTPDGTRIVVTAGRENGLVRLAVRDNGVGIESHALQRIFEPFYTADDAQGSGLGLAIASELAERMSGQLWVRSLPGQTTFTLELPSDQTSPS
jgi:signal transduction histidine kinase